MSSYATTPQIPCYIFGMLLGINRRNLISTRCIDKPGSHRNGVIMICIVCISAVCFGEACYGNQTH